MVKLAAGENPNDTLQQARREMTFADLFAMYMERHAKLQKRTWQDDQREYDLHLARELGGRLFAALDEEPNDVVRDFFRVALFTGARRGNILEMKWTDIDLDAATWRIPACCRVFFCAFPAGLCMRFSADFVAAGRKPSGNRRHPETRAVTKFVNFPGR